MFFILSKILGFFCYPLSLLFLAFLLFVGYHRRRPKLAWGILWAGMVLLFFCSTPWGADTLLLPLERPYEHAALPAQADVILVLGGSLDLVRSLPEHLEYGEAADRFIYSLLLAKQFPQAKILYAGGTASFTNHSKTEASLLKAEAIRLGIAPDRIRVDDHSRNTRENALEAKKLLSETGGQSIVVITSAFHMKRSLGCLRKVGVQAIPYAADVRNHGRGFNLVGWAPQANRLNDSTSAIREYVGLVMYRLQGYM